MSEEELMEIIKENLKAMKSNIEMNTCFEINSEQAKDFYFAIATVLTIREKQREELEYLKNERRRMNYENQPIRIDLYYKEDDK